MKRMMFVAMIMACAALSVNAQTITYGWEDGTGTILDQFGNLSNPTNVTTGTSPSSATVTPYAGNRMLQVTEAPHGSTPSCVVARITGLNDGDSVFASFYAFDDLAIEGAANGYPAARMWGSWADATDGS